jgi:hypothetical protein
LAKEGRGQARKRNAREKNIRERGKGMGLMAKYLPTLEGENSTTALMGIQDG